MLRTLLCLFLCVSSAAWALPKQKDLLNRIQKIEQSISQKNTEKHRLDQRILALQLAVDSITSSAKRAHQKRTREEKRLHALMRRLRTANQTYALSQNALAKRQKHLRVLSGRMAVFILQTRKTIILDYPQNPLLAPVTLAIMRGTALKLNRDLTLLQKQIITTDALRTRVLTFVRSADTAVQNLRLREGELQSSLAVTKKIKRTRRQESAFLLLQLRQLRTERKKLRKLYAKLSKKVLTRRERHSIRRFPKKILPPVRGKIIQRFGSHTNYGTTLEGIRIRTKPNAPVKAPYDGKVAYVGLFGSVGEIVILEHQEKYFSTFFGIARASVHRRQIVHEGDRIATMPRSRPILYYELRHKSRTLNPLKHMAKGGLH